MGTLLQEDSLVMEEISVEGYEKVYRIEDPIVGLKAIICLHDVTLGPCLGGTRIYPYPDFDSALTDVKRLAKGMTYKSVISGCSLGGGKSVIIANPSNEKKPELLKSFGRALERLQGAYVAAEDVGCSTDDIEVMASVTKYVVGLIHDKSSGNPSYYTAWGVYKGIQASLKKVYASSSVKDRTIAIQGVGSVGSILAGILFWEGANLIVSDRDEERAAKIAKQYGAVHVKAEQVLEVECDVFAPCALGGSLNEDTIPKLRCKAVAGAANNQLLLDSDADLLAARGILYAPDFVINAGGLINVTEELYPNGYSPSSSREKVDMLYDLLLTIFDSAEKSGLSTHQTAVDIADYRLKNKIGLRTEPLHFHHFT
jgi:leucine dehydrogenase